MEEEVEEEGTMVQRSEEVILQTWIIALNSQSQAGLAEIQMQEQVRWAVS